MANEMNMNVGRIGNVSANSSTAGSRWVGASEHCSPCEKRRKEAQMRSSMNPGPGTQNPRLNTGHSTLNTSMSRSGFVKTMGVGMAALAGVATAKGSVAHATPRTNPDPGHVIISPDGMLITVRSTGANDTVNIRWALSNVASGGTVFLPDAQYYCNQIYVENFRGVFKGAGKDRTVLDVYGTIRPVDEFGSWFVFNGGNILLCDMSFNPTPSNPAQKWIQQMWGASITAITTIRIKGASANSNISRVNFKSNPGTLKWYGEIPVDKNILAHIWLSNDYTEFAFLPMTGNHQITSCSFEEGFAGILAWNLSDGNLKIGGSPGEGNVFNRTWFGALTDSLSNCVCEMSYNTILDVYSSGLQPRSLFWYNQPGEYPQLSTYTVTHNNVRALAGAAAIESYDYARWDTGTAAVNLAISQNTVTTSGEEGGLYNLYGSFATVWIDAFVERAIVSNNVIRGVKCYAGIYVGPGCSEAMLLGNNLNGLISDSSNPDLIAPIWLNEASNCTVVGGNNIANVLDMGTNNILTGVNNMHVNIGQNVKDAMNRRRELMANERMQR